MASSRVATNIITTNAGVQGSPSWFRRDWVWGSILILIVFLAYTPIWHAGFIWDDDAILTANPCIVGPLGLKEIWTTSAADICPLTISTFWVEHALWGLAPLPYHLVNVLLHGACAVLLWRVLRCLRVQGGWLGAALWALHPVEVESVAWITEMKNTESACFFLLSVLFFVRSLKVKELCGRAGGSWNYALSLLFGALAMASKSSTVILPVVLCLCAWWTERRWQWSNVVKVIALFLISIAASALSIWTQGLPLMAVSDPQWVRTWPQRLATAGDAVWFYLGKLIWPYPLVMTYPRWRIDAGQWVSFLPLVAVIVVLCILWIKRRVWARASLFAFAYFTAALLPALGLIDIWVFRYSLVFDHFQYLASVGPLALAGAALARFSDLIIPKKLWLQSALCGGLLLSLGLASWHRTRIYESMETLWTDTLTKNPDSWLAHGELGLAYFNQGKLNEAIAQYQMALKLNPSDDIARAYFGDALFQKGESDEAIEQYKFAIKINPKLAEAYYNLGLVSFHEGRIDDAIAGYQKALEIDPNFTEARNNLGSALLQIGHLDEAIAQYQMALEINPSYLGMYIKLGETLFENGQSDEAIRVYEMVVKMNPNGAEIHNDLGAAFYQKGQFDAAVAQFHKALEINPNYAEAYTNLGNALFQKGHLEEAIEQYQMVIKINPTYAEAHNDLGVTLYQKGQLDDAIAQYQMALDINPKYAVAHGNLGAAFFQKGRLADAIEQFREALRLNPDLSSAKDNLAKAENLLRDTHP